MQLACFVYIKRCWLIDKKIIENYAKYVSDLCYKHSLLVFPEGTDFTESTKTSSDNYAQRNGLQVSFAINFFHLSTGCLECFLFCPNDD